MPGDSHSTRTGLPARQVRTGDEGGALTGLVGDTVSDGLLEAVGREVVAVSRGVLGADDIDVGAADVTGV